MSCSMGVPGGKFDRREKVHVERIFTVGRTVDQGATLEDTGRVLGIVQAHQRAPIVEGCRSPVFDITKEVVHPAIRAKIVSTACWPREVDVLARGNCHAVVSGAGVTPVTYRLGKRHYLDRSNFPKVE